MTTNLSTDCLSKMLSNATWVHSQALRLGVKPLIVKYGNISNRLRNALKTRLA